METNIKNDNNILIGSNIKRIRQQKHIKPKEVVSKVQLLGVDINVFSLSKIEANTQHIKASQFRAIAEVLQVDYTELLKTSGEVQKENINKQEVDR